MFLVSEKEFWMIALKENNGSLSSSLCSLVALSAPSNDLDSEIFVQLTNEKLLPVVGFEAALCLLQLEKDFIWVEIIWRNQ
jgi:hypothetical protein